MKLMEMDVASEEVNTSEQNRTKKAKAAFLEALEKSLGVVKEACDAVGIGRTTYYDWRKSDYQFSKAADDVSEILLDFAEAKLYDQIKNGNTTAIIFFLKTRGKKRGYVERQEITGANGLPANIQIEIIR